MEEATAAALGAEPNTDSAGTTGEDAGVGAAASVEVGAGAAVSVEAGVGAEA